MKIYPSSLKLMLANSFVAALVFSVDLPAEISDFAHNGIERVISAADSHLSSFHTDKKAKGGIKIAISLIWEGDHLKDSNIEAFKSFRSEYPNLKFLQFLNPAYLTKKDINKSQALSKIKSLIRKNDPIALHIHSWKSLVEAAGVNFRTEPTFWANRVNKKYCMHDCGHEVPLSAYSPEEIRKIVGFSKALLVESGFSKPKAFLAGAWMASNQVLEAVVKEGLFFDFSAVSTDLLSSELEHYPLKTWLKSLWGQISYKSQPYLYYTNSGWIKEMGMNAASLEYSSAKKLTEIFESYAKRWQEKPDEDYFLHFAIYQETALQQIPKLRKVIDDIYAYSVEHKIPISLFEFPKEEKKQISQLPKIKLKIKKPKNDRERRPGFFR